MFGVAYIDVEKAHDRVNRKKLFEIIRGYGVDNIGGCIKEYGMKINGKK